MPIDDNEFNAIMLADKWINSNIRWREDKYDRPDARSFRVDIETGGNEWAMFVKGRYISIPSVPAPKLSFTIVLRGQRIYALDIGRPHHPFMDKHKHANGEMYEPKDITAPASNPVEVWEQFCREARIEHRGSMDQPPQFGIQERLR